MAFEYDANKSAENKRKHGIDFGEAQELWIDADGVRCDGTVSAIGCRSLIGTECRRAAIGREAPDNTDDSTYSNCQEKLTWQIGTASVIAIYLLPRPTAKKLTTEK